MSFVGFYNWGTLRIFSLSLSLLIFLVLFNQFDLVTSCITKFSSSSRRLIRHSTIASREETRNQVISETDGGKPYIQLVPPQRPFKLSPYSRPITSFMKFLLRNMLVKSWTLDLLGQLDNLKRSLVNFSSKQSRTDHSPFPGFSYGATARDKGIGFPSLEGALLSLAFLTFSVFLIDLIQTLLAKLKLRTAATAVPSAVIGRGLNPTISWEHDDKIDDTMATLSSQVLSAIENPLSRRTVL